MRILIVWKNDYPWDVRVEKMSVTLASCGHDVHILARDTRGAPRRESVDDVTVHRLGVAKDIRVNKLLTLPTFLNPFWRGAILRVCREERIEVLIVRDLPLAPSALEAAGRLGIPAVFDMAEDYPAMWCDVIRERWYAPQNYLMKNPWLGRILEKRCARRASHILVVVEESRRRLVEMGVPSRRVSIVSNTPRLDVFDASRVTGDGSEGKVGATLFYHGYVNRWRGVETVVRAMPSLLQRYPGLSFVVAGDGTDMDRLRRICRQLHVEDQVEFLGWVSVDRIPEWITGSDICVIPHLRTPHKESTIPNKLFDYMAMGKPVIVSDVAPLKRIVEEHRCGVVYRSNDPAGLAGSAGRLLEDPALCAEFGRNGRSAVMERYNWERDAERLKGVIESLRDGPRV
jgi:glycosyltransferase involved in cell wall biosynthesis